MTERRRWPNEAENQRQESIAEARRGLAAVRKAVRGDSSALVEIVDALHLIIEKLTSVGPGESTQVQKTADMLGA